MATNSKSRSKNKPSFIERLLKSVKNLLGGSVTKKTQYRRLTKQEAEKLNLPHSAKRYVRADLKRVTKKTATISQRHAVELNKGLSKEAFTATRQKNDKFGIKFYDVKPEDYNRIIKKAEGRQTQIIAFGDNGRNNYQLDSGEKFSASTTLGRGELREMLAALYSKTGMGGGNLVGYDENNLPRRIDIRLYHTVPEINEMKARTEARAKRKRSRHDRKRGK